MAKWTNKISGDSVPTPGGDPSSSPQKRGMGFRARAEKAEEEYKESVGLLQQFVMEGLKRAQQEDDSLDASPMTHFAELYISGTHGPCVRMRVPGRDEAKALQNIMSRALGFSGDDASPLQRQQRSQEENGKRTYVVFFKTQDYTPGQCKEMLERALRALGVEPDWQKHYTKTDREAEAAFRDTLRDMEEGDTPPPRTRR